MKNIANLIISEDIYSDDDKNLLIYKPVGKIYIDPSPSQNSLFFTFFFINLNSRPIHQYTISCTDPNGIVIWKDEFIVEDTMLDENPKNNSFTASAEAKELEFNVEGTYEVILQHEGTKEINVVHFDVEFKRYTITVSETEDHEQ